MRPALDRDHAQLSAVLADLLARDVDVTARAVARQHPTLKNVTAFTRNRERMHLIEDAKRRQNEVRAVVLEPHRERIASVSEQLQRKTREAEDLHTKVEALVSSHVACVRAVLRHGGMPALERFWNDYKTIGATIRGAGAVPTGADVTSLTSRPKQPSGCR